MDAVREVLDSLKGYLKDRLANPLYAAYIVAWSVLNFRLLLVLVGEGNWREKINYVDHSLYKSNWDWTFYGFLYPLLVAAIYVIASPFISRWVTVFLKTIEKETVTQLLRVAGETPLPKELADRLRRSLTDEQRKRGEQEREADLRIDELREQVAALSNENATLKQSRKASLDETSRNDDATEPTSTSVGKEQAVGSEKIRLVPESEGYSFKPTDFAGTAASYVERLVQRGLTRAQVEALYRVRNYDEFDVDELQSQLALPDRYSAKVMLDKLSGLDLIEVTGGGDSCITSLGRQALDSAMSQGFVPTSG